MSYNKLKKVEFSINGFSDRKWFDMRLYFIYNLPWIVKSPSLYFKVFTSDGWMAYGPRHFPSYKLFFISRVLTVDEINSQGLMMYKVTLRVLKFSRSPYFTFIVNGNFVNRRTFLLYSILCLLWTWTRILYHPGILTSDKMIIIYVLL